ncbi:hypothetical protein V5O48_017035 [Marasmius crinis-equi]|uniref:Uncharacterized protein n=1 Tax=Marasmius crinis-equi TaxID=585013 RepID=A0ABR3EQ34_9AGAR
MALSMWPRSGRGKAPGELAEFESMLDAGPGSTAAADSMDAFINGSKNMIGWKEGEYTFIDLFESIRVIGDWLEDGEVKGASEIRSAGVKASRKLVFVQQLIDLV